MANNSKTAVCLLTLFIFSLYPFVGLNAAEPRISGKPVFEQFQGLQLAQNRPPPKKVAPRPKRPAKPTIKPHIKPPIKSNVLKQHGAKSGYSPATGTPSLGALKRKTNPDKKQKKKTSNEASTKLHSNRQMLEALQKKGNLRVARPAPKGLEGNKGIAKNNILKSLAKNGKLPSNYITKKQAKALGWNAKKGNLHIVAPGKSIGGNAFKNREGKLPNKKGRVWREADLNYKKGFRNKERLLYSNDGLAYVTKDHYKTFQKVK